MSSFFTDRFSNLVPYTPGEQPRDKRYNKLNTNESPYPPSPGVTEAAKKESEVLYLYSDPECIGLRAKMSEIYKIPPENILMTNGSDEILNFAFMAFADEKRPLAFPDITYGFYPVFAQLNHIPYNEIPLKEDFTIDINDYIGINKTIVIANPNAPTGITLSLCEIEKIVSGNPDNIVIIDEAYIDFGGESALPLLSKYDNLLICGTFSKSRSMAGARLGYGFASKEIIADLNTIKYSTNPYNVNRMTSACGIAALCEDEYYKNNAKIIEETRAWTTAELEKSGFEVLPSKANFVFAQSPDIDGGELYLKLKERGILIRHFTLEKIKNFNRITIGKKEQMESLIDEINIILEESK